MFTESEKGTPATNQFEDVVFGGGSSRDWPQTGKRVSFKIILCHTLTTTTTFDRERERPRYNIGSLCTFAGSSLSKYLG